MIKIGLTGSIGMGKTTVAEMLRDAGVPVHDADTSVHGFLGPGGAAVARVGTLFPDAVSQEDGKVCIDREKLGQIVFFDREKKQRLEDILHPLVIEERGRFTAQKEKEGREMIAYDIPLLFETGADKEVDVTLCVTAPVDVQRERVMERPGMTADKFDSVVAGQMPDVEKQKRADYVVENGGDREDTKRQLTDILYQIRARHERGVSDSGTKDEAPKDAFTAAQ